MYKNKTVGIIFPTHNEESNILSAINEFSEHPFVDEVLVVDNNSYDSTKDLIHKTNARYIFESNMGYGQASITGLSNCSADLIVIVEPDGTFSAADLEKFLSYSDQFGVIFGSRNSSTLIWEKANMPNWIRFGNWVCAKEIELLFGGPSLSDVGCTYKLIRKESLDIILKHLYVSGSHFSPHLMIECIKAGIKCVEIPINYYPRIGKSKITGNNPLKTIKLGLFMFAYILFVRLIK